VVVKAYDRSDLYLIYVLAAIFLNAKTLRLTAIGYALHGLHRLNRIFLLKQAKEATKYMQRAG
jgi:hypothetical protein